jgi:YD repeat-containing protein
MGFSESSPEVELTYNDRNQYDTISFGNGLARSHTYDDQGRLTSISNTHPAMGTVASYTYGYDQEWPAGTNIMLGQRVSVNVAADPMADQITGLTKYRYDADYQLVQSDAPNGGWQKWQYDAIGNRITKQTNTSSVVHYNYYKFNGNVYNSSRLLPYTYDANGNRLGDGAVWDLADRLVNYDGTTYTYDYASRRSKKNALTYTYDGLHIARERDVAALILNDYIFGPGIDEPLVRMDRTGSKSYYAADGLGSVVAILDAAGSIAESNRFDAWGARDIGAIGSFRSEVRRMG